VIIGDSEGHVGLGIKTSKEVATAIRAAIIIAKLSVVPIRRGYWGTNLGEPHSLPVKGSGKCGSVTVRVCLLQTALLDSDCLADTIYPAHPRSPWYRHCSLACRQASSTTCWCTRRLLRLFWKHKDPREHTQGYLLRSHKHIRLLDAQPVEGDQALEEPVGGIQ